MHICAGSVLQLSPCTLWCVCAVVRRVLPLEADLLCVSASWQWAVDVVETCSVSVVPPLPMQASTDTVVGGIFEGTSFACDGYASDDVRL